MFVLFFFNFDFQWYQKHYSLLTYSIIFFALYTAWFAVQKKSTLGTVCVKDSSKDNQHHLIPNLWIESLLFLVTVVAAHSSSSRKLLWLRSHPDTGGPALSCSHPRTRPTGEDINMLIVGLQNVSLIFLAPPPFYVRWPVGSHTPFL